MSTIIPSYDFIGIGAGPANLSLAALSTSVENLNGRIFERASEFVWHPGILFQESLLQTSFLKDLVTPIDPTNPYSFLSYLVSRKQLYSFITASFEQIPRKEFSNYLAWAAQSLPNVALDTSIENIETDGDKWTVHTSKGIATTKDIVMGTGRQPAVPECAQKYLGKNVFHANQFCFHNPEIKGKRVAVIGGGQSGAEVVNHLIADSDLLPERLVWVSRRSNYFALDDSPFANEWYTPSYSNVFYNLPNEDKSKNILEQILSSDGVSIGLLQDIYRRIYQLRFIDNHSSESIALIPSCNLKNMTQDSNYQLEFVFSNGETFTEDFDVVILATGYRWQVPPYMQEIAKYIELVDGEPKVCADFSIQLEGLPSLRLFAQNATQGQRGVADPNLSLLAWRSAKICNQLARHDVYDCEDLTSFIKWPQKQ